jgi:enediyne biosynthesis protein E4
MASAARGAPAQTNLAAGLKVPFGQPSPKTPRIPEQRPLTLLAIAGTTRTPACIIALDGEGNLVDAGNPVTLPLAEVNDGPLAWLDVNGDGRNDLLVTRGGNNREAARELLRPRLYLGIGDGRLREAGADALPDFGGSVGAVAVGDVDRDGRDDVFIGGRLVPGDYPTTPESGLWRNDGGKLIDVTGRFAPALRKVGLVTAALWCDIDGDGWQDLVLALDWGGLRCFRNLTGTGMEDASARLGFDRAGKGWWRALAVADFNGDGRPDLVAGNVGLNTQHRADSAHPALLYAGHFTGTGATQLIEAYFEGESIFPWRTREALAATLPWVARRFPTNETYARATLPQIVGVEKLAAASRLEATELRSGVLLSQPDGTYRFEALPRVAQIAPAEAIATGDFDGDGHPDIFLAQNSFAPIPSVGRFDGGLGQLLLGNGAGHFEAVPPRISGLIVPGDAKAVIASDLDGDGKSDLVVSQNSDAVLFFHNHGVGKNALPDRAGGATTITSPSVEADRSPLR